MKNKNNLPIYLSLATIFGIFIGAFFSGGKAIGLNFSKNANQEIKIKKLINFIENDYVDKVDTDSLLDGAIAEMLSKLDPHSVYMSKEVLQETTERMQGNFVGIGVEFRMIKDSVTVIHPIENGPSFHAGIKAGDRILIANKDTLYGKNFSVNNIPSFLKGQPDTNIKLQIYRKSNDSLFTINLTRASVKIKSVSLSYMLNDSIGYIKLIRFSRSSYKEFSSALSELKHKGMTNLILDLRGNGGGFIDIANSISDEFLEDKKLIVFTKNNKEEIEESFATSKGKFETGDLYVLIDENSASASEIVAGALQDNDKGTIIGRRSFGKGLVQVEMDLGDGSAVRLTTARYYTPTGRSIQKPYRNTQNYNKEYEKRFSNGELFSKDSIKVQDTLKFRTPKGKIVYGGGGIIPDVFVAADTINVLPYFYANAIYGFAFNYVDTNRNILEKWTLEKFIADFDSDNTVYKKFIQSFPKEVNPSKRIQEIIKKYLKANIADNLFGNTAYFKIVLDYDKMLQKVLELESSTE